MRAVAVAALAVVAAWLAGCTVTGGRSRPAAPAQPTGDLMPSSVLDHQDPGADTSHNPVQRWVSSGSPFDGLFTWHAPESAFGGSAGTPHYYKGCGGCSTDRASGALLPAIAVGLGLRRRRRRARATVTA
jgi:MYXO-CTERM domain-containing protein